jgi:exopolysaccharide biosynthesis predicted pyruvyltransferase EpsI
MKSRADEVWAKVIPKDVPCALIDFPAHSNVGDSAIWLGEVEKLCQIKTKINYVAALNSFNENVLRKAMPNGTILIHGGGNFGSIWRHHQDHREMILERMRDYKVVQLPQSIHFGEDSAAKKRMASLIQAHPDFTLLTRDNSSFQIGQGLGANTLLCPDSAAFLHGILRRRSPQVEIFSLARTDSEKSGVRWPSPPEEYSVEIDDWLEEKNHWLNDLQYKMEFRAHGRLGHLAIFQKTMLAVFNLQARRRVERGVQQLSRGKVVATDRLHAHILSSVLDIPNVVLDNNYGKIHGYMDCWGTEKATKVTDSSHIWHESIKALKTNA